MQWAQVALCRTGKHAARPAPLVGTLLSSSLRLPTFTMTQICLGLFLGSTSTRRPQPSQVEVWFILTCLGRDPDLASI